MLHFRRWPERFEPKRAVIHHCIGGITNHVTADRLGETCPSSHKTGPCVAPSEKAFRAVPRDVVLPTASELRVISDFVRLIKHQFCVVSVSHSDYLTAVGGTEKYITTEQKLLGDRHISYIHLAPTKESHKAVWEASFNESVLVNIDGLQVGVLGFPLARYLLRALTRHLSHRVLALNLHHMLGWSAVSMATLLEELRNCKKRFFVHDYYAVCQQHNLLRNGQYFCGGGRLNECLHGDECSYAIMRKQHVEAIASLLASEQFDFIVPSDSAAKIWSKSHPEYISRMKIVPHLLVTELEHQTRTREVPQELRAKLRIAYVGYPGVHKGLELWEEIVNDDGLNRNYEFYIFGLWAQVPKHVTYIPVNFIIDGDSGMQDALRRHEIDMVFLWSICAETYSYTFHEALAAGCFVLTNVLSGNIQAQVSIRRNGRVFAAPSELVDFLRDPLTVKKALDASAADRTPKYLSPNHELVDEICRLREDETGETRQMSFTI